MGCHIESAVARTDGNHRCALREVSSSAAATAPLLPDGYWGSVNYRLQLAAVADFAAPGATSSRARHLCGTSGHGIGDAFGRAHPESADSDPRRLSHPQHAGL